MATATSGGHLHPTATLWPIKALASISESLKSGQGQRVTDWVRSLNSHTVEWQTTPIDPFFNINTPDDVREAERLAGLLR
jgi:molybdopterin-guanine dinucleotide biosynthesis protein A